MEKKFRSWRVFGCTSPGNWDKVVCSGRGRGHYWTFQTVGVLQIVKYNQSSPSSESSDKPFTDVFVEGRHGSAEPSELLSPDVTAASALAGV